jgi:hypothetical protein
MKIYSISHWDLHHAIREWDRVNGTKHELDAINPHVRAMHVLINALEIVNQAGLDGKKLTDIRLVERRDPVGEGRIEVHAKVTHRILNQ